MTENLCEKKMSLFCFVLFIIFLLFLALLYGLYRWLSKWSGVDIWCQPGILDDAELDALSMM